MKIYAMRCIFCKQDSSASRSIEHVMPESLGSKRRILRPGVVCDKCNNYFARKVEKPILDHPSMRNLRAWYQVPNKRGKSPSVLGRIAGTDVEINLSRGSKGNLRVEPERERDRNQLETVLGTGPGGNLESPLLFTFEMNPPEREMSRFLSKIALETIAENFSSEEGGTEEMVDEPFFDNIRAYARYGTNYTDWPYSQRRIYPEDTQMRHPETNEWVRAGFGCCWFMNRRKETLCGFSFYGIEFVINAGGPSIRGYEEWLVDHDHIGPMVERVGAWLFAEGEGPLRRYYLEGGFSSHKGIEFDRAHGYTQEPESGSGQSSSS